MMQGIYIIYSYPHIRILKTCMQQRTITLTQILITYYRMHISTFVVLSLSEAGRSLRPIITICSKHAGREYVHSRDFFHSLSFLPKIFYQSFLHCFATFSFKLLHIGCFVVLSFTLLRAWPHGMVQPITVAMTKDGGAQYITFFSWGIWLS